jgi:hypothetical protein
MRGREGELWGIVNLLSFTGDTIKTLDVLDAHKQKVQMLHAPLGFEINICKHIKGLLQSVHVVAFIVLLPALEVRYYTQQCPLQHDVHCAADPMAQIRLELLASTPICRRCTIRYRTTIRRRHSRRYRTSLTCWRAAPAVTVTTAMPRLAPAPCARSPFIIRLV